MRTRLPYNDSMFGAIAAAALYTALMGLYYPYRNVFAFDPDEGITAMWARLVAHGDALYTQIWINQPPLFIHAVRWWCTAFGWQVDSGRVLVLLFAAAGVFALYDTVRIITGHAAAALACLLLSTSAYFPRLSVSLMQGVPSLALAMLALWALARWQRQEQPLWIAAAGVLMAGSLTCKLSSAVLLPPFAAWLMLCRRSGARSWQPAARWLVLALIASATLLLLLVGAKQLPALVGAHLAARRTLALQHFGWGGMALTAWAEWPLTILGLAGNALILYWWLPAAAVFPLWAMFAAAGMVAHVPYWYHHQLLLSAPNCAAAGIAAVELFRRDAAAAHLPPRALAILRIAFAALVVALPLWTAFGARLPPPTLLTDTPQQVLAAIDRLASDSDVIVSNEPMYAFRAGAIVPPELAALPLLRVATDPRLADEVQEAFAQRAPQLVVLTPQTAPALLVLLRAAMADRYRLAFERAGIELYVRRVVAAAQSLP